MHRTNRFRNIHQTCPVLIPIAPVEEIVAVERPANAANPLMDLQKENVTIPTVNVLVAVVARVAYATNLESKIDYL